MPFGLLTAVRCRGGFCRSPLLQKDQCQAREDPFRLVPPARRRFSDELPVMLGNHSGTVAHFQSHFSDILDIGHAVGGKRVPEGV